MAFVLQMMCDSRSRNRCVVEGWDVVDARSGLFTRFEGPCLASVDGVLGAYKAAALFGVSVS